MNPQALTGELGLGYATDLQELDDAANRLLEHLGQRVSESQRASQLSLFAAEAQPPLSAQKSPPPAASSVSDLHHLISQGVRFPTIYADPPWPYANTASRAAAENHYPTMTLEEICAEPVAEVAEQDAHLHLWTTNAFLREAFAVIEAWGFQYKSCFVWVKGEIGMGNYWRVSHEYLMLGVRGSLTFRDRTLPSWIQARRTAHSRKPGLVRALIERVSPGPYLELYGREELPASAWTVYGNQVERRLF